jgi:hypothetical protein
MSSKLTCAPESKRPYSVTKPYASFAVIVPVEDHCIIRVCTIYVGLVLSDGPVRRETLIYSSSSSSYLLWLCDYRCAMLAYEQYEPIIDQESHQ